MRCGIFFETSAFLVVAVRSDKKAPGVWNGASSGTVLVLRAIVEGKSPSSLPVDECLNTPSTASSMSRSNGINDHAKELLVITVPVTIFPIAGNPVVEHDPDPHFPAVNDSPHVLRRNALHHHQKDHKEKEHRAHGVIEEEDRQLTVDQIEIVSIRSLWLA